MRLYKVWVAMVTLIQFRVSQGNAGYNRHIANLSPQPAPPEELSLEQLERLTLEQVGQMQIPDLLAMLQITLLASLASSSFAAARSSCCIIG
eukprot:98195-Pelagomonas_calceolata.AAC.12